MDRLSFKNDDEVVEALEAVGDAPSEDGVSIAQSAGFRSLLDSHIEAIGQLEESPEPDHAEGGTMGSSSLGAGSVDRSDSWAKLRNPYAAIANELGEVDVGGVTYNVLTPEGIRALTSLMPLPYPIHDDPETGYKFVTVANWVKMACHPFPCFATFTVPPLYSTRFYKTHREPDLDWRGIVIQLWKGHLPPFGLFPGGVGAEVGVYYMKRPKQPLWLATWLPYHEAKWPKGDGIKIGFEYIDRDTKSVVFDAKPERTWWKPKWMTIDSFYQYQLKRKNKSKRGRWPNDYKLDYWINDKKYTWRGPNSGEPGRRAPRNEH